MSEPEDEKRAAVDEATTLPFTLLTQDQVRQLLGLPDRKAVDRLVDEEALPKIKVRSRNRFLLEDVQRWVEAHRTVATPPSRQLYQPYLDPEREEIERRLSAPSRSEGRLAG